MKKKKIKIHRVKKRTNVSDFKNEKSEWLGWKNRRSNAKSQSAATRFIEFHWPNTFNLRTSVFDEEQRDPWHSRCGARCIHRPFLFETRAGANDSTCSYTSLPREDECSSKYSLDSSLRATNNVHLYVYKMCIKAWVKEFSIILQMGSLYEVESITRGMIKYVIIMLKRIYAIKNERIFALPYVSSVDKRREWSDVITYEKSLKLLGRIRSL